MRSTTNSNWLIVAATLLVSISAGGQRMTRGIMSPPANVRPPGLKNVGIEQNLNEQIPASLTFRDETGKAVRLGDYFAKRPMILNLVYYQCPMLCGEVLSGLESSLRVLKFDVGKEFGVLTVSFDPRETPEMAAAKKASYLKDYNRDGAEQGWHFLTGDEKSSRALADAVGFHFVYDTMTNQYAHPSAIMILTSDGQVARYFYGIDYQPRDVRLGLVEASAGRIGSPVDQVLLYCYHYDPSNGKYGMVIMNVLRIGGLLTLGALAIFMIVMFRRDFRVAERGIT
jgi:protein SCO1